MLKSRFHQQVKIAGIKPFMFGDSPQEERDNSEPQPPYAVSSEKSIDMEVMDASTLMSPDYVQPLVASELATLVQKLFDRDNLAWMRHSAAKKLAQRRNDALATPGSPILDAFSGPSAPETSVWSPVSSFGKVQPSYTMARIADYTQREERIAQVQLAQWATDLQRSLQNERDRYTTLARGDRAVWLTERLNECVVDGSLVPIPQAPGFCGLHIPAKFHAPSLGPHDPLGVVSWIDDLGQRGWVIVQIVGSIGIVGGLALWMARSWGLPARSLSELHLEYLCGTMER